MRWINHSLINQGLVIGILMLSTCTQSYARDITIYLNKTHEASIQGMEQAKENGHRVSLVYMDKLQQLEEQTSARITADYQHTIDAITREIGLDTLMAMDDHSRTELFMQKIVEHGMLPLSAETLNQPEIDEINEAGKQLLKADEQGITAEMLPAILIDGRLYENNTRLDALLDELSEDQ